MPSLMHELLLRLFSDQPGLAPRLLHDALQVELPDYSDVSLDSADLGDVEPAEYRADMVVKLAQGEPVLGIVVEVQLSTDHRKQFAWPAYIVNLRARLKCPVLLLVVADDEAVARWARTPIDIGGGFRLTPLVLSPSEIPVISDASQARANPELAVLSAVAHGNDADIAISVQIAATAQAAVAGLDDDRVRLYLDLIMTSLSEAARQELRAMDPAKYEYQSDFAKSYIALGKAEGKEEGKAEGKAEGQLEGRAGLVSKLLTIRFGALPADIQTRVAQASLEELDAIGERLLSAASIDEALGAH